MHTLNVHPLMAVGKDSEGHEVHIDAALLAASSEQVRQTMHRAIERYFASGGSPEEVVRISITVFVDAIAGTAITPEDEEIDLEKYSPEEADIIRRRLAPP